MYSYLSLLSLGAPLAAAHTTFTTIFIDDATQGDGTCVRMNMNAQNSSSPIPSLFSDDMACGSSGEKAVAFTCPATAGAKLSFEWRMWADLEQEGALDPSHKGPCAVYAKQVADMSSTTAAGSGWFKIFEEGYDETTEKWCTEKLIDDGGIMSIQIPSGLPSGNYLFRPELLALHNADAGDPQFYVGCAQIQVQGTNQETLDVPEEYSVSIPGYVSDGDASVSFNIYTPVFPYPMPGPNVYSVPSGSSLYSLGDLSSDTVVIEGANLVPDNYLIKEANWVGVEVADYSTEDGCWKASEECYNQVEACYDSVPPTGSKNCQVWEAKCDGINDACSANIFVGPPNKGQKLEDAELRIGVVVPAINALRSSETNDTGSGSIDHGYVSISTSTVSATTNTHTTTDVSSAYETITTATKTFESAAETNLTPSSRAGEDNSTTTEAGAIVGSTTSGASSQSSASTPCRRRVRRRRDSSVRN